MGQFVPEKPLHRRASIVTGRIKNFNRARGFGFVTPEDRSRDILLHITQLQEWGFEAPGIGADIVCEVEETSKGPKVCRVISVNGAEGVLNADGSKQHAPLSEFEAAKLKWFDWKRGFGFITRGKGTEDIFVHAETLRHDRFEDISDGQRLLVRFQIGETGPIAVALRRLTVPWKRS